MPKKIIMNTENKSTPKTYKHITKTQRIEIQTLYNLKKTNWKRLYSQAYIWQYIWVNQSSIQRELQRNSKENTYWKDVYKWKIAQTKTQDRRTKANIQHRFYVKNRSAISVIEKAMSDKKCPNSPSVIASAILPQQLWIHICTTTLYSYIHHNSPTLKRKLRFKSWYRKRKTCIEKRKNYYQVIQKDQKKQIVVLKYDIGNWIQLFRSDICDELLH